MKPVKYLYRLEAYEGFSKVQFDLVKYKVIKHTPKGYWIQEQYAVKKWVSKGTRKRFAYDTKEGALTNFIKRKQRYLKILKGKVSRTENFLKAVETIDLNKTTT